MLRLLNVNKKAINLTRHRPIPDRVAVSERYKIKLQKDLERTLERKNELEILIACNDKDISHWKFWALQKGQLRALMEKIPIFKKNKQ